MAENLLITLFAVFLGVMARGKTVLGLEMPCRKIRFESLFKQNLRFHGDVWALARFFAVVLRGVF
jgi:hypothetical protein